MCVPIAECPCLDDEFKEFAAGDSYEDDCNTCTCVNGKFDCTEETCSESCDIFLIV